MRNDRYAGRGLELFSCDVLVGHLLSAQNWLECKIQHKRGWRLVCEFNKISVSLVELASTPITKSDVAGDVVVKAGKTPKRRRIDRNISTITHEAARTGVKNHDAN